MKSSRPEVLRRKRRRRRRRRKRRRGRRRRILVEDMDLSLISMKCKIFARDQKNIDTFKFGRNSKGKVYKK